MDAFFILFIIILKHGQMRKLFFIGLCTLAFSNFNAQITTTQTVIDSTQNKLNSISEEELAKKRLEAEKKIEKEKKEA
jgi:hypothetical protein